MSSQPWQASCQGHRQICYSCTVCRMRQWDSYRLGTTKDGGWDHADHARWPRSMQTKQKVIRSKHTSFTAIENPQQLPPWSRERHKDMQAGMWHILDGSCTGINTASTRADRAQANQGVGKVLKPNSESLDLEFLDATLLPKNLGRHCQNGKQAKQIQKLSFSLIRTAKRKT